MKFKVQMTPLRYQSPATWLTPIEPVSTLHAALPAYLAGLGLASSATSPVALDAETREAQEARWAVFVEQGVALRDPEALRWYADQEFARQLKANPRWTSNAVSMTVIAVTKAAGGVLPPDLAHLNEELHKRSEPIEKIRVERRKTRPLISTPPPTRPDLAAIALRNKFDMALATTAREELKKAGFLHPKDLGVSLADPTVPIIPTTSGTSPSAIFEKKGRGRRSSTSIVAHLRRDWLRKVHKPGLTFLFGPRTFVLHAEVSDRGTFITLARQHETRRGTIKVEHGWLSFDRKNQRVLKKEKK